MSVAEDTLKIGIIQNNPEAAKAETVEQTPKVATVTKTSTNVDNVKSMENPANNESPGSFVVVNNGDVKTNPVEGNNAEITSTDKQVPNKIETGSADQNNKVDEKLVNELVKDFGHILGEGGIAALKEFITNGGEGLEKVFMDADGDGLPDYLDKDLKSRAEIARDEMLKLMDRKLFSLNKGVGNIIGTVKKVLSRIIGDESNGGLNAASKSLCKSLGLNTDDDKGNATRAVAEKSKAEMINMQN